jgi:hypothetical protein
MGPYHHAPRIPQKQVAAARSACPECSAERHGVRWASTALESFVLEGEIMSGRTFLAVGGVLLWGLAAVLAADKQGGDTFTDAAQAGPDFEAQGEYVGNLKEGDATRKYGVQVIALGDGALQAVAFPGGLPGAGWDGKNKIVMDGRRSGDKVTLKSATGKKKYLAPSPEEFSATSKFPPTGQKDLHGAGKEGMLTLMDSGGTELGMLKKIERKSSTLGAKPPEGAIVLFDGKSAEKFKGGKIVMDDLLAVGCETLEKFGDHTLHCEFRLPFMPKARGQGRANSGVYPQGRYEIQVLDSFGLEGENNECGGIYSIAKPAVNMCYPPLSWQTYDIEFTAAKYDDAGKKIKNARATVKHNGVVIHDDLELTKGTPGKDPEGPGPGPLYLQDHGNPVHFRNIWVVKK